MEIANTSRNVHILVPCLRDRIYNELYREVTVVPNKKMCPPCDLANLGQPVRLMRLCRANGFFQSSVREDSIIHVVGMRKFFSDGDRLSGSTTCDVWWSHAECSSQFVGVWVSFRGWFGAMCGLLQSDDPEIPPVILVGDLLCQRSVRTIETNRSPATSR